jgi:hypothetical protein
VKYEFDEPAGEQKPSDGVALVGSVPIPWLGRNSRWYYPEVFWDFIVVGNLKHYMTH